MTDRPSSRRRYWTLALGASLLAAMAQAGAGCGSDDTSKFGDGKDGEDSGGPVGSLGSGGDGSADDVVGDLTIEPRDPVLDVTILNGTITSNASVTFEVKAGGNPVAASFTLDRGELGTLVAGTGVFTASGAVSGKGRVTAQFRSKSIATNVTVHLRVVQNGGPPVNRFTDGGLSEAGAGGYGGVGGNGPGGAVADDKVADLRGPGTAPATPQELGWLYPYDKTVWPRGFLPPLLQWQTTHAAEAVYIHLKQGGYEFEGFYSGTSLVNQPLDETAWKQATNGNEGDDLVVEIKTLSGNKVYGPITENWTVAPGILRGAVYYNSYTSKTETGSAGVLAIKPGARAPTVAIPGKEGKCVVCHTLSDDGSTLFAQEHKDGTSPDWRDGLSVDLKNGGSTIRTYTGNADGGTSNVGKFLWSAVYPDGTFAMTSSWKDYSGNFNTPFGTTQGGYDGYARLVRRDNGNEIAAEGWDDVVKSGVTPAFSQDGKHLAFNFWTSMKSDNAGGNGATIDVMDFACTPNPSAPAGTPSCDSPKFSNLRRVYGTAGNGYVGWPAWLADGNGLVFHNVVRRPDLLQAPLATWQNAQAELWYTDVPASKDIASKPVRMNALNGRRENGDPYLPTGPNHGNDAVFNYEPTMAPAPAGGYYWVVFTSRRLYGNVLTAHPHSTDPYTPKKLWVAAIDLHPEPGKDPSHPAFYLPGQELAAGNLRGFWVNEPCRSQGTSCETGQDCCTGFCRAPQSGGALVCSEKPADCAQELEKCNVSSDCCGSQVGYTCINNRCSQPPKGPR